MLRKSKLNNITEDLTLYIDKYHPDKYAYLVSGSYIDGTNNKYSDVDIVVFKKDINTVFNETSPYEDLKVQTIIVPIHSVQDILWADYTSCKGSFVDMVSKGIILHDESDFLKDLISHSKKLKEIGGRPLSDYESHQLRIEISSLLFDVMGSGNMNELIIPMNSIIDMVSELKIKSTGNWCGDGKCRMRHLKALDGVFYSNFIKAIDSFYNEKDKTPFVSIIKEEIERHGGMIAYYSKGSLLSKVTDNYMVVELDTKHGDILKTKNTIKVISDFIDDLKTNDIEYYFFSSKPIGKSKIEQNIYFIIHSDMTFINDYIIDRLRFLISNKEDLLKTTFPFQFDPTYMFSTSNIYSIVLPLFCAVSELFLSKPNRFFNQSFQMEFSLSFMRQIKNIWFANDSDSFVKFSDYLLECWMVFSYDDGLMFKIKDLLKNKDDVEGRFGKMYLEQKEDIVKIYKTENFMSEEINSILKSILDISDFSDIPEYKSYFLDKNLGVDVCKRWSLYKEITFRVFQVALIDNRFVAYIPFVISKIENND